MIWGTKRTPEPTLTAERWFLSGCYRKAKSAEGPVADRLRASGASEAAVDAWLEIAARESILEDDDEGY